jgi:putative phosphoribosyl transferase
MASTMQKELVRIKSDSTYIEGMLEIPPEAVGVVLFAHGSGSSRLSPRNNYVAEELRRARLGTLLLDLLTKQEDQYYRTRFDITLLTQRLNTAVEWLRQRDNTGLLPLGLFGASTGAAAALQVAAIRGTDIAAVVSRGGRPDMAGSDILKKSKCPHATYCGGNG